MSYARFSYADVYVFMSTSGHLECCGCILGDQWAYDSTQAMVDHLAEHRAAGHDVPDGIEQQLRQDDRARGEESCGPCTAAARAQNTRDNQRKNAKRRIERQSA